MDKKNPKIGIAGGAGPYAGIDLFRMILEETVAEKDQDYLDIVMVSTPGKIEDRTRFLLGETETNPAEICFSNIINLETHGATFIGIPCNTAHAEQIWSVLAQRLEQYGSHTHLLNMIGETANFLEEECPKVRTVGILSTLGTWKAGFYPSLFGQKGYQTVVLNEKQHRVIHDDALFNKKHVIKVQSPILFQEKHVPYSWKVLINSFHWELKLLFSDAQKYHLEYLNIILEGHTSLTPQGSRSCPY